MDQLDFSNINPAPAESLEDKFTRERSEWIKKTEELSKRVKNVLDIPLLMTDLYTERQTCVEYYHYLISILIKVNKEYKSRYAERYDFWTWKSQIKYPNENAKNIKIQTEIGDLVQKREMMENHSKYIQSTISTIDNIIYAIPRRVEIEQISRGK